MIECKHVTKQYRDVKVLKDLNLSLEEDGIYCLLGRNGAGKTTLLRSIAGVQNITAGEILVDGAAVSTAAMTTDVSYIENFAKHFNYTVFHLVELAGRLNPSFDSEFAREMLTRFELDGRKRFKKLSLGMKTMVSTVICLASNKRVILLDEPVLGFDAIMRAEFYDLLLESYERNPRVIIISTHIIDEIEKTAQRLMIIDRGELKFYGDIAAIDEKAYAVTGPKAEVEAATAGLNVLSEVAAGGFLTRYLFDHRIEPGGALNIQRLSLQDFFVRLVENKGRKSA